jgi:hypothetical protein
MKKSEGNEKEPKETGEPKRILLPPMKLQKNQQPVLYYPIVLPNSQKLQPTLLKPKETEIDQDLLRKKATAIRVPPPTLQNTQTKKKKLSRKEKGLRYFSQKVCEKVQQKGETTYSEVANELVDESKKENEEVILFFV